MDGTKLGPSFDAVGIGTAVDQDYPNDGEMEDIASSSVRIVGKVVGKTDVSSLGLSPQVAFIADQRCASTATGLNRNGCFNGTGIVVAPVPIAASTGSRCNCR